MASTDLDPLGFPEVFDTVLDVNDLPNTWAALLEVLGKRVIITFNNQTERDTTFAGLGPNDVAYAYLEDTKTLWRWNGSAWASVVAWVQTGTTGLGSVAANATVDVTISFPVAFIDGGYIPNVMTSFQAGRCTPTVVARNAGSMQIRFFNNTGTASTAGATVYWSATRVL